MTTSLNFTMLLYDTHANTIGYLGIRVPKLVEGFLHHGLFKNKEFEARLILPMNQKFDVDIKQLITKCGSERDGPMGLSCRVDAAYWTFLDEYPDVNWYFRAIDDTWLVPEKLKDYLEMLNQIIDPRQHIVMKALQNPWEPGGPLVHGGTGWLLSRATIQFFRDNKIKLADIVGESLGRQDDTAQSNVAWRLFEHENHWHDPRLKTLERESEEYRRYLNNSAFLNYTNIDKPCDRKCDNFQLNKVFAYHTRDEEVLNRLSMTGRYAPDTVFQSHCGRIGYSLCVDTIEYGNKLSSLDRLRKNTPLILPKDIPMPFMTLEDRRCQYSMGFGRPGHSRTCRMGRVK